MATQKSKDCLRCKKFNQICGNYHEPCNSHTHMQQTPSNGGPATYSIVRNLQTFSEAKSTTRTKLTSKTKEPRNFCCPSSCVKISNRARGNHCFPNTPNRSMLRTDIPLLRTMESNEKISWPNERRYNNRTLDNLKDFHVQQTNNFRINQDKACTYSVIKPHVHTTKIEESNEDVSWPFVVCCGNTFNNLNDYNIHRMINCNTSRARVCTQVPTTKTEERNKKVMWPCKRRCGKYFDHLDDYHVHNASNCQTSRAQVCSSSATQVPTTKTDEENKKILWPCKRNCGKMFDNLNDYRVHQTSHCKTSRAQVCSSSATQVPTTKIDESNKKISWPCKRNCGKSLDHLDDYHVHNASNCQISRAQVCSSSATQVPTTKTEDSNKKLWVCDRRCGKSFDHLDDYHVHNASNCQTSRAQVCSSSAPHVPTTKTEEPNEKISWPCKRRCGKSFDHLDDYYVHNVSMCKTSKAEIFYSCSLCPRSFSRPDLLRCHMKGHTKERSN
ncbi:zinc finger protein 433-like [Copidosoma floridanum]|uniref:zinc finger protein 433-like n=1 Tax=Copidosoma floridanum TaxID=29053 RepID=UPI0006C9CCEB|nr:zinc finger protein 433-like [Copidosoma floridanum]